MRQVKFRAWDKVNKKMHYDVGVLGGVVYVDFNGNKEYEEVSGHVLMEYTGLKDKDGKEIYNGDILKLKEEVYRSNKLITVDVYKRVFYHKRFGQYLLKDDIGYVEHITHAKVGNVVGNIFENVELIVSDSHE